eukprot:CAMPEP_0204822150 /NCGR_PEP_ID=MMETSP1346-20131115/329_1 /ASSEMBLY_ACC=CAM_ASM_000771 /TAXON_ID=215587 /ORGANISM="Aplanochytrium stocchinoi, Strain GSBS06" /LENGTH=183 /DNA_ID=CAMNT_0051948205 /DNA_START=190 /DNA_END=738 /DNA_ORIENTATION=+
MSKNTQSLLLSGAAVAVVAAGIAIAAQRQKRTKQKRKIISQNLIPVKNVEALFEHDTIQNQFPDTMQELEDLYKRDIPRMEGLEISEVETFIEELEEAAKHLNVDSIDNSSIRKAVIGCCTQAVLAQGLSHLMEEETMISKGKCLLLHHALTVQIDHATKAIVYQLGWRVVDADDPETIVGFW